MPSDIGQFEQCGGVGIVEQGIAEDAPPKILSTISASALQQKSIPPIRWIVQDLIPAGLTLLASPPKFGKSWQTLDLCLSVSSGLRFLGYQTNRCGTLYCALEDSERRLKTRMNRLLDGRKAPDIFHFATAAETIDNGLFEQLEGFLNEHPETGLVAIDTLQRVRGSTQGREGAYAADYRELAALKQFADKRNVALLLVHHLRKMADDGDPFNRISGTAGVMGAADTAIVLEREKRDDANTTMHVVGRDVESSSIVLRFDKASCRWMNLGDADAFAEQQTLEEYRQSPIVKTIKALLGQSPDGWEGTASQLMEAGRIVTHTSLADSAQALTKKLKALDKLLLEHDAIGHERKRNGSGGGKHRFLFAPLDEPTADNPFL